MCFLSSAIRLEHFWLNLAALIMLMAPTVTEMILQEAVQVCGLPHYVKFICSTVFITKICENNKVTVGLCVSSLQIASKGTDTDIPGLSVGGSYLATA